MRIPRFPHDKEFLIKNYSRPVFKNYLHGKQALAIKLATPERFRDTYPERSAYIPGRWRETFLSQPQRGLVYIPEQRPLCLPEREERPMCQQLLYVLQVLEFRGLSSSREVQVPRFRWVTPGELGVGNSREALRE